MACHGSATLFIHGTDGRDGSLIPVGVAADMGACVVIAQTGVEYEAFVHVVAVHKEQTSTERLKVRDDKSPSAASVVLVLKRGAAA